MGSKGFRDLVVWRKAKDLAVKVYQLGANGALGWDSGLREHIYRSAVSIASNLAEGDERGTDKESIRFFFIAKGSLAEFRTQMQIAHESGQVKESVYRELESDCEALGKMLGGLIKARHARSVKVR